MDLIKLNGYIPPAPSAYSIDYSDVKGLRTEAIQKLSNIRPVSIGQASRISGVSPADISVLLIYLEHQYSKR